MKITQCVVASERGEIAIYTLTNAAGASVKLSALGAGILSIVVPDREGNMADVALGYADAAQYISDGPCMGKSPVATPTALLAVSSPSMAWIINLKSTMALTRCMAVARASTIRFGTAKPLRKAWCLRS